MQPQNLVILSLDEVRPDHLSCYGYEKIQTPYLDSIAEEGVLFEKCIASSCLTPICMGSTLAGVNPPVHGMRNPFCHVQSKMLQGILQDRGYKTAGFVGNGLLAADRGFGAGFDFYDEPIDEKAWFHLQYPDQTVAFAEGNWFIERMLDWLRANYSSPFFLWGHHYETHEGAEQSLLDQGLLEEGKNSEFGYYDGKIKLADDEVVGRTLDTLKELGIYDDTTVVVMSDHGTTIGEHPANLIPWRDNVRYPQHTGMWDTDLHVFLAMKGQGLPRKKRVKGVVREIDITPTLLDLLGISTLHQFEGVSLRSFIESGQASGLVAYAEEMFDKRGPGNFQAVRTQRYKYIVDRRHDSEEQFYDLLNDPGEQSNIIDIVDEDEQLVVKEAREVTDFLLGTTTSRLAVSDEEKEKIQARLRTLGYIK